MSLQQSYRIETDERRNFMRLTFSGYMDLSTFEAFESDLSEAHEQMDRVFRQPGSRLTLVDLRQQVVQSQEIAARLQACVNSHRSRTRRVAMVTSGSALLKIQARRIADGQDRAFFVDEETALQWLFEKTTSRG